MKLVELRLTQFRTPGRSHYPEFSFYYLVVKHRNATRKGPKGPFLFASAKAQNAQMPPMQGLVHLLGYPASDLAPTCKSKAVWCLSGKLALIECLHLFRQRLTRFPDVRAA